MKKTALLLLTTCVLFFGITQLTATTPWWCTNASSYNGCMMLCPLLTQACADECCECFPPQPTDTCPWVSSTAGFSACVNLCPYPFFTCKERCEDCFPACPDPFGSPEDSPFLRP